MIVVRRPRPLDGPGNIGASTANVTLDICMKATTMTPGLRTHFAPAPRIHCPISSKWAPYSRSTMLARAYCLLHGRRGLLATRK